MKIRYFGLVVPTFTAPKGTLYLDVVGQDLYINTDGATTWVIGGGGGSVSPHKDTHKSGGSDAFTSTDLLEAVVKRLQESAGPTTLTLGAIADGQFFQRSGTNIVGVSGATAQEQIKSTPERFGTSSSATAFVSNDSYFYYLGKTQIAPSSAEVVCRVTTAAATITWAEVGIFTGSLVLNGNASLTRRGYTDVSGTFNSTGTKVTTVSVSGIVAGDDVWLALGSQATTAYRVRATDADQIQSGMHQSVTGRISTLSTPVSTTLQSTTFAAAWASVRFS